MWRGGWRWEGDGARRLCRVVHRQNEACAADGHVLICQGELLVQTFVELASSGRKGVLVVDGARAGGVGGHRDVGVHGAHAGVVHDEIRIIVMKLAFVLEVKKE